MQFHSARSYNAANALRPQLRIN